MLETFLVSELTRSSVQSCLLLLIKSTHLYGPGLFIFRLQINEFWNNKISSALVVSQPLFILNTDRKFPTKKHAFVTSRIDYCNSLLYGISDYNINRLHRIQNTTARIVTNTGKYDHITQILQKLHWLPTC